MNNDKVCALADCGKPLPVTSFTIHGREEAYCSRECRDKALHNSKPSRKSKSSRSKDASASAPAPDFGDAGVVQQTCKGCGAPLGLQPDGTAPVAWTGRDGVYCSNDCLKKAEPGAEEAAEKDEGDSMASPISGGAAAAKKVTKKNEKAATKKAAATKKGAAKSEKKAEKKAEKGDGNGRSPRISNDAVIKVIKDDHGLRGKRGEALDALKDGITVEKFKAALAKKDMAGYAGWALKTALERKLISVKE